MFRVAERMIKDRQSTYDIHEHHDSEMVTYPMLKVNIYVEYCCLSWHFSGRLPRELLLIRLYAAIGPRTRSSKFSKSFNSIGPRVLKGRA